MRIFSFNQQKWGGAVLLLLVFSHFIQAQQFYDSGRMDKASDYFYYNTQLNKYLLLASDFAPPPPIHDTAFGFSEVKINRDLTFSSRNPFHLPRKQGFYYFDSDKVNGLKNKILMARLNPLMPGNFRQTYLSSWDFCRYHPDSITDCIQLTSDSAYDAILNTHWFLPNNDTLYAILTYTTGKNDSIYGEYFKKLDTVSGTLSAKNLNLNYQGGGVYPESDPVLLNNGHLLFTGRIVTASGTFSKVLVTTNRQVDSIFTLQYLSNAFSDYNTNIWVYNETAVVFDRGARYDPNFQPSIIFETVLEVFDLKADSLIKRYFFPFTPPNNYYSSIDVAGPGAYFDGEHFILSATVDELISASEDFKTVIFAVDTNFNMLNSMTIKDSNRNYYGLVNAIIPEPDSAHSFIYAGYLSSPQLTGTNTGDLMWGRFKVDADYVSTPEVNFRKGVVYLYPNPASEFVDVIIDSPERENYELQFYNTAGELVMETEVGEYRSRIPLKLKAGVYTVVASSEKNTEVLNLVVQ